MRISVAPFRELGPAQLARWSGLAASVPSLDSPYFAPEWAAAVDGARGGVRVAVLEEGGAVAGLFPFEAGPGRAGHPVGLDYADFQGVVAPPELAWDGPALLRGCGLAAWHFDHLLASQAPLRPYHWGVVPSPCVDLSQGFEAYRAAKKTAYAKEIEKVLYEARKAERRAGPLRFELQTADPAAWEALARWKGSQYLASGQPNRFELAWVRALLERVRAARGEGFEGLLSALWIGDRLAAVHLGMRSRTVLHYWLPAYDPDQSALSPGQLLFLEVARAMPGLGVRRVDLGKGQEPYKVRLATGDIAVAEGAVHLGPLAAALGRARYRAAAWARGSALRPLLRAPARWLRRRAAAKGGP